MLNRVTIMGNLCSDPELKRTQSGLSVTSVSVAVERDFKGGEKDTDFFNVVAWRKTAEFLCQWFTKGRRIAVDGRLQSRRWKDKNGNDRVSVEVVADSVYFADSKRDGAQEQEGFQEIEDDGDLPF